MNDYAFQVSLGHFRGAFQNIYIYGKLVLYKIIFHKGIDQDGIARKYFVKDYEGDAFLLVLESG